MSRPDFADVFACAGSYLETTQMNEEERLIGYAETSSIVGVSKAEIQRRVAAGKFPAPIKDGPYPNSRTFFVLSEILAYVQAKIAASRH